MMNEEILKLIQNKSKAYLDIRNKNGNIEIKIPCTIENSEISWIQLYRMPIAIEKLVRDFLKLGGKIE